VSEFPGVVRVQRDPGRVNETRGNRKLAGDATIGNAEFANVLKTTD
jgi:hypothetical protein